MQQTGEQTINATTILTFPQFMQRMAGRWPLRGVRRVAVIGADSCAEHQPHGRDDDDQ